MKTNRFLTAAVAAFVIVAVTASAGPIEDALALLKQNDPAGAEAIVAPLATAPTPDAAALDALAQIRVAQKRSKEAVALAEQATKLEPTNADYASRLGVAYSARMGELGFMQQAMIAGKMRGAFERAVEIDPKHVHGLIGLARYYANAPEIAGGSLEKAAEFATRVRAINPFLGELELARIAERGEKFDDALAHYRAALELKPDSNPVREAVERVTTKIAAR